MFMVPVEVISFMCYLLTSTFDFQTVFVFLDMKIARNTKLYWLDFDALLHNNVSYLVLQVIRSGHI